MKILILAITGLAAIAGAQGPPADVVGDWQGVLHAGAVQLHVVIHLTRARDGRLHATLDSVDQGAMGIPIASAVLQGATLHLDVVAAHASYEGHVRGDTITGTWTQGGASLPLAFERVRDAAALRPPARPQDPVPPFPYRAEDVTYGNPHAGIRLAGTLTLPEGPGPFPAAILISGSGAQDRNETVFGHHPFLVLADYLTRRGVAVLRSDDRGVGGSGGPFAGETSADFATDVESALAYLTTRPEIDARKIGLIGHSEGGLIAPMVAVRHPEVAFVVMWAGPGVPGADLLVEQVRSLSIAAAKPPAEVDKAVADERAILAAVARDIDPARLRADVQGLVPPGQLDTALRQLASPWLRYFLTYDPAVALRRVRCPVLALIGSKDTQVPAAQNVPAIRQALEAGGNRHFEVDELPGLNHLLQPAKTGGVDEYGKIPITIAPEALEKMATWIVGVVQISHA